MLKIAVLVSGGGTNLQAIMDRIEDGNLSNTKIEIVISNNKAAMALERAEKHKIKTSCLSPKDFNTREEFETALLAEVEKYKVDLIVLAGYLVIIPKKMIEKYRYRIINIHPSLIPSFCGTGFYGRKVHESVLNYGAKITGATVHFVDEGTDTGPIILQKAVKVKEGDTPEILQKRVMEEAEWEILPKAISMIANGQIQIENNLVIQKR
ncbi:MAG: phosphoribosylglycinamide formyltransferase [Acetivibrio sp.]